MSRIVRRRGAILGMCFLLSLLAGVLVLSAGTDDARAGSKVTTYNMKGLGASYNGYEYGEDGTTRYYSVYVSRTDKDSVWMYYYVYSYNPGTGYYEYEVYGYGDIPDSTLSSGTNGKTVRLDVDTSQVDGFTMYYGTGGVVSLEWTKNGAYSESSNGNSDYTYDGVTTHSHQNYSSDSANVEGEIHDVPSLPAGEGTIYDNHSTSVTITH